MSKSEEQGGEGAVYDAELREWAFTRQGQATVAIGRVYHDRKGRWPDGYMIATSAVLGGGREEGAVITTLNTRYLLAGPTGDLPALLKLAYQQAANAPRRESVAHYERLFDLLPAAWGMDDAAFERIAGLPAGWLWQWRNHYRAPSDEELVRIRRLLRFHDAIGLVLGRELTYAEWWRGRWRHDSLIGNRSMLEALTDEPALMDEVEAYLRSQIW